MPGMRSRLVRVSSVSVLTLGLVVGLSGPPASAEDVVAGINFQYDGGYSSLLDVVPSVGLIDQTSDDIELPACVTVVCSQGTGSYAIKFETRYNRAGGPGWAAIRYGYYNPPNSGFGWTKAISKHNFPNNGDHRPIMFVAETPKWKLDAGSTWEGRAYVRRWVCDSSGCTLDEEIIMVMFIDERRLSDARNFGLVTVYCGNYMGPCPDWATTAATIAYDNHH